MGMIRHRIGQIRMGEHGWGGIRWTILCDDDDAHAVNLAQKDIYSAPYGCRLRPYSNGDSHIVAPKGWVWSYAGNNMYEIRRVTR